VLKLQEQNGLEKEEFLFKPSTQTLTIQSKLRKRKFGVIGVKVWVYKGEAKEPLFFT